MLDETNLLQRLGAEAIGTAFLVFIGVGSVPATLIVNGNAPFTMADLGMISLAFGTIVIATVYALGHIGGNHINPAVTLGLAVSGKFPWAQVPAYIGAQVVGAIVGAAAIIGVLGHKASDVGLGVASYGDISWRRRPSPPSSSAPSSWCSRSSASSTARPPPASPASPSAWSSSRPSSRSPRPPAHRSTRPAPSARCSSSRSPAATVKWEPAAGLPRRRAPRRVVAAALLYGVLDPHAGRPPPSRAGRRPRRPRPRARPPTASQHRLTVPHPSNPKGTLMKKLINDPNDVVVEALLGIEAAHPDLRVDHHNKVIYRGDAPKQGKVGHHLRRRLGARTAARRVRRPGHARRRVCRRGLHLAGARTRCWRRPSWWTAAQASCTSSRTTPATS